VHRTCAVRVGIYQRRSKTRRWARVMHVPGLGPRGSPGGARGHPRRGPIDRALPCVSVMACAALLTSSSRPGLRQTAALLRRRAWCMASTAHHSGSRLAHRPAPPCPCCTGSASTSRSRSSPSRWTGAGTSASRSVLSVEPSVEPSVALRCSAGAVPPTQPAQRVTGSRCTPAATSTVSSQARAQLTPASTDN
jgi:hypothetical protein